MRLYIDQFAKHAYAEWAYGARISRARSAHPDAVQFFGDATGGSRQMARRIDVYPGLGLIYIAIPKVATSYVRSVLSVASGRISYAPNPRLWRQPRRPLSAFAVGPVPLWKMAQRPETLVFSFVRNPYGRAVSCWANKFQGRPLVEDRRPVPRLPEMNLYLQHRAEIDPSLPHGADGELSFPQFLRYAAAMAPMGLDGHIQPQSDILARKGLEPSFVGRLERFSADFREVLDRAGAYSRVEHMLDKPRNRSARGSSANYYTAETAALVRRIYSADFERFDYPDAVPE